MPNQYPKEVRQRAVRLVLEHRGEYDTEYQAIRAIGAKCNVGTETLLKWVRQADVDAGAPAWGDQRGGRGDPSAACGGPRAAPGQ